LYQNEGIDGLVANNYQGKSCKLSDEQIKELKAELDSKVYRTAEAVCEYARKTFKVRYAVQGMVQTLHRLHIICDNARYQQGKEEKQAAKGLTIHLVYLPGYSPDLNLIERYWGFMKKRILVNRYYKTYETFRDAILRFSRNKSKRLKKIL
jgi:transposase